MKERVYISGKISEEVISQTTKDKFAKAEEILLGKGYRTFNPTNDYFQELLRTAEFTEIVDDPYTNCLLNCLVQLTTCDIICLLPDWRESPGAKAELAFAQACGIQVKELMPYGALADWKSPKTNNHEQARSKPHSRSLGPSRRIQAAHHPGHQGSRGASQ